MAARKQSFSKREEGLWVVREIVDVENRLWVRQIILLQVVIKSCPWSSGEKGKGVISVYYYFIFKTKLNYTLSDYFGNCGVYTNNTIK